MSVRDAAGRCERLESIRCEILECTSCPLSEYRTNPVPGEGDPAARALFVGEAPGRQEDEEGRPFVGRAGSTLDAVLGSVGIDRPEIFITNVVKCRPPGNRDPHREEIRACLPYLLRQIEVIEPSVIVPLGRVAAGTVMAVYNIPVVPIGECHGRIFSTETGVEIIPLYHPAAISYNRKLLPVMLEDIRRVRDAIL
ncbi:MAG: uracil-DNA glycosylase family protein [Methanoculleaceae archaeon]